MNPNKGGVQRVSDTLGRYFISKGHSLFYLIYENEPEDSYSFPGKIFILPDRDFFSKLNIHFYHNLLSDLAIDVIINHDGANDRSRLFLNTGNSQAKKLSVYHTDPVHELFRSPDLSRYIKNKLLRESVLKLFSKVFHKIKVLKKKRQIKLLLKQSDRLILLSASHKDAIIRELHIDVKKTTVINNPVIEYSHFGSLPKSKLVLFVGRLETSVKRPDVMLRIWSELEGKYPDWQLLFLGDGPDRNNLELLAQSYGLKNVHFKGFVDPEMYYKNASILCMTSVYEGFPSVLLEAMLFGLVPIAFNNWSSLKEVIVDNASGMLVDTGDLHQYIGKLDKLLSNAKLRRSIASNAVIHAKKYKIDVIGPQWDSLFAELIKK